MEKVTSKSLLFLSSPIAIKILLFLPPKIGQDSLSEVPGILKKFGKSSPRPRLFCISHKPHPTYNGQLI